MFEEKPKTEEQNVNPEGKEVKEELDLDAIYEESFKSLEEGSIITGTIIDINDKEVVVDIGYKSEGILPLTHFKEPSTLKVGDHVDVLLEDKENDEGMVIVSKSKADLIKNWESLINNNKEGDTIEGTVARKVKGGLMVDIGIQAFLPASLAGVRSPKELGQLVGQSFKFKIIKINKPRKNIVVSRKDYIEMEMSQSRDKLLAEIEKGQTRKGTVKNITDFGAFIDLGGLDGLLHITDMSWGRISHPSEMLAIGDEVEVVILDFDKENKRVSLGLKQKTANPWEDVKEKYPVDSKVKGKVVNLVNYGAFVELEKGIEGLIHISEFSWTKRITDPSEMLAIGDVVEVVVLNIDKDNKKISLGLKQIESNPWEDIAKKYPEGSTVKGKVRHLTNYGAFVELEDGIEGLIHVSDMSWTKKINHPEEVVKKGDKIEAKIISIDPESHKISLGLKQLKEDPWPAIKEKYAPGLIIDGKISKVMNFGLFVELEEGIEGLVHVSELEEKPAGELTDMYKPGDDIKVRVIKLDDDERKIGLSAKSVS
jgi:small subunit ribosomal protein S1